MTATYKLNSEHNGIEIYFDAFPGKEILDKLREFKWRWHKFKKCWYNKQTEENINLASSICNQEIKVDDVVKETPTVVNVHGVKVGDIFCTSWGYDMTIVEYFQVVRVTAKRAVVREIGSKCVDGDGGYSGKVMPIKDNFISEREIETGTEKTYNGSSAFLKNCNEHRAYAFDGKPSYFNHMD